VKAAESSLEQERLRFHDMAQRERMDLEAAKVGRCIVYLSDFRQLPKTALFQTLSV